MLVEGCGVGAVYVCVMLFFFVYISDYFCDSNCDYVLCRVL